VRRWIRRLIKLGLIASILFVFLPLTAVLVFRFVPVPLTPLMVIRLAEGEGLRHKWVPLERISPHLRQAVIASEDNRFCEHGGIDWTEYARVWREYQADGRLRGASTISMQTVKNVYLWPSRSYVRKGLELMVVPLVERMWNKRRIMEVYLNVVEFGPGLYGAQAASQHHFGVPAARLTRRQAAQLAAVLPNPRVYDAGSPGRYVRKRARQVEQGIVNLGPMLDCVAPAASLP
jgi:monofunctional biosynthetic peptidoglycan transglycosylase